MRSTTMFNGATTASIMTFPMGMCRMGVYCVMDLGFCNLDFSHATHMADFVEHAAKGHVSVAGITGSSENTQLPNNC
jgi:hypothetical protein